MSSSILAVHRKSARLLIAGVLLSVAIALRVPPEEQKDKDIIEAEVQNAEVRNTEEPQIHNVAEPVVEYTDGVDSFAHFLYGDINRNNKQK